MMRTEYYSLAPQSQSRLFVLLDHVAPLAISQKAHLYYCRYRSRRQLLRLNDDQLTDIGLNREQALAEAALPFWR